MLYKGKGIALVLLIVVCLGMAGCIKKEEKPYKESQFLMDTYIEITAYGPQSQEAVKKAFEEFARIDRMANVYKEDSAVSQVNQAAGVRPVVVPPDVIRMVQRAKELYHPLHETFALTVGPLTELWGIGKKDRFVPTQEEINQALSLVNDDDLQVDVQENTLYLTRKGMKLDMGGIAKGYAVDRVIEVLKEQGVTSALINAGGDVRVIGRRPDGQPWRVGIQDPRKEDGILAKLSLTQWDTMETSGDYQRYFMKDGIRYSHILNPKTGRQPTEVTSVTMIMNNSTDGDILSTALMILGPERGLEVLKQFPGVDAVFVTKDGKKIASPGLEGKIEW